MPRASVTDRIKNKFATSGRFALAQSCGTVLRKGDSLRPLPYVCLAILVGFCGFRKAETVGDFFTALGLTSDALEFILQAA